MSSYWNVSCLHLHLGLLLSHLPHSEQCNLSEAKQWGVRGENTGSGTQGVIMANGTQARSKLWPRLLQHVLLDFMAHSRAVFRSPSLHSWEKKSSDKSTACLRNSRKIPTAQKSLLNLLRSGYIVQWECVNSAQSDDKWWHFCSGEYHRSSFESNKG